MAILNWGIYGGFSLAFAFKYLVLVDGWRWAFRVAGMPGIILAVILFFTVKERDRNYVSDILSGNVLDVPLLLPFTIPSCSIAVYRYKLKRLSKAYNHIISSFRELVEGNS